MSARPSAFAAVQLPRAIAALYFLSGCTGLAYEVLWVRMLGAQFGASIVGVAITAAAFMLGLGAGSLLAARLAPPASPALALRRYALLEAAIALYALALPAGAAAVSPAVDALAAHLDRGPWLAVQGAAALLALALPAAAMGATFPTLLATGPRDARSAGRLYGWNCLGAAAGSLLGLALLAAQGWDAALRGFALLGGMGAIAALLLSRHAPGNRAPAAPRSGPRAASLSALVAYAGVGAAALALEVGWTRLYGLVLLRTDYLLALILAIYLLGTGLGSLLALCLRRVPAHGALLGAMACGAVLAGLWALPWLGAWAHGQEFPGLWTALAVQGVLLAVFLLPVTLVLGAWLPLLAHRLPDVDPALLYAANCAGGVAGALLVPLAAIPLMGSAACVAVSGVALLALARGLGAHRTVLLGLPVACAAAWALHALPAPGTLLGDAALAGQVLSTYEDALTLNHVVEAPDGQRLLLTDLQHMDAASDPSALRIQADQARLALLLHPAPRAVLFLGLGTGISASGSLAWPYLSRTAVELSPGAIAAASGPFAPVNGGVMAQLAVTADDARHYLAQQRLAQDVIVGDLFHPDLAGMSALLSVEQFARARRALAQGGVFVQWLALNQFDRDTLQVVLRSFARVFPHSSLYIDGLHLAMVGGRDAVPTAADAIANLAHLDAKTAEAATGGEGGWTWLGRYWGPIASGDGPVQSEVRPVIEFRLPRLRYGDSPLPEVLQDLLRKRPSPAQAMAQLQVPAAGRDAFAGAYLGAELAVRSWLADLTGESATASALRQLAVAANPHDRWTTAALADERFDAAPRPLEDRALLLRVLALDPTHVEALRALWHLDRHSDPAAAAQDLDRLRGAAPLDREARTATR